jgi:hypothetical protein
MAELFKNKSKMYSKPNNLETKYNSSIANLLLVVVFSAVNIVLLLVNADTYFLFSAFLPYFAVDYGMFLCGMYPEEYYYDMPDTTFEDKSFLGLYIAIAAAFLLAYLLCWYLAKKKKIGAVILALVMFLIDTAAMLWLTGFVMDSIIDILMHIWVISYLVIGIVTYFKIKKAPQEELCDTDGCCEAEDEATDVDGNSKVLRMADDVKCRVFVEAEEKGMHIVFRRVKRTNELVINGCVYDEYEALAEFAHTLTAKVNGHRIEAVYDGASSVKIFVDSQLVAKKMRIF